MEAQRQDPAGWSSARALLEELARYVQDGMAAEQEAGAVPAPLDAALCAGAAAQPSRGPPAQPPATQMRTARTSFTLASLDYVLDRDRDQEDREQVGDGALGDPLLDRGAEEDAGDAGAEAGLGSAPWAGSEAWASGPAARAASAARTSRARATMARATSTSIKVKPPALGFMALARRPPRTVAIHRC